MAQGTLWFQPIQNIFKSGIVVPAAKAYFYLAGTTTPVNVYSDVGLTTLITQPVVADANGVFVEIFLTPGTAYKVDVQTSAGVSLTGYPADNQLAIPASAANVAQSGTAGEAITGGQPVYLSDGSGGKNAGQWYKGDSANPYSSSIAEVVGIAPASVASGATGTFVVGGQVGGLSVTPGTDYFIGSSALTATAPANTRYLGRADSVSSIVLAEKPGLLISPTIKTSIVTPAAGLGYGVCGGRLTLTPGVPVTTGDVTGATTVYFSPYSTVGAGLGNIGLYDGSANWTVLPFAEISMALGTLTSGLPYDVFAFNNSGVVALRAPVAWTSTSARATALVLQNGVLVKTGATTDRYLGTFYTTSTTQTEDSLVKRFLWNYYNRVPRVLARQDSTGSWTTTSTTPVQANASASNQVDLVVGVVEGPVTVTVLSAGSSNGGGGAVFQVGIGVDSATAATVAGLNGTGQAWPGSVTVTLCAYPTIGRHFYTWLNWVASNTGTFYGTTQGTGNGLSGWING